MRWHFYVDVIGNFDDVIQFESKQRLIEYALEEFHRNCSPESRISIIITSERTMYDSTFRNIRL